jgi:hypothetical protein
MRFRKITETENRHKITEITGITDSFNQWNYFDKNKQHVLCDIHVTSSQTSAFLLANQTGSFKLVLIRF